MSRHSNTPATDASVLLVQLSDSHLFAEDGARLLGMDTAHSLEKVVERVAREQPRIDLILATGDVSQDGSLDSYTRFRRLSAPLDAPLRWFAGNHDEREPMQRATEGSDLLEQVVDVGNWRVVLLDSSIPGAVPGYLEEDQLELLRRAIDSAGERFLLVSFHHHPVPIGSDWMDPIGLRNPQALFDLLAPYPQVRCLLWGHIHQEFDRQRGPLRLLASPSTCVQFAPRQQRLHPRPPGAGLPLVAPARRRAPGNGDLAGRRRRLRSGLRHRRILTCPRSRDTAATCVVADRRAGWKMKPGSWYRSAFPTELKPISPFPMTATSPSLLYIHGFNSSPESHKARQLQAAFGHLGLAEGLRVPALHHHPRQAIAQLERAIAELGRPVLVGSSLGGYYATHLAERHGLAAILVNPAVAPHRSFDGYLGAQTNHYSGETWELTEDHVAALAELEVTHLQRPERYQVWLQTADETLDYRVAQAFYRACALRIQAGGDHGFQGFARHLPALLAFAGYPSALWRDTDFSTFD